MRRAAAFAAIAPAILVACASVIGLPEENDRFPEADAADSAETDAHSTETDAHSTETDARSTETDAEAGLPPGAVVQIAGGAWHVCARRSDGQTFCFGENAWGQAARESASPVIPAPARVSSDGGALLAADLAASWSSTCARSATSGAVYCFGGEHCEGLGRGACDGGAGRSIDRVLTATGSVLVVDGPLAQGAEHACAVGMADSVRGLFCWGSNSVQQIDAVQSFGRINPAVWSNVSATAALAAPLRLGLGEDFSCALVAGWGDAGPSARDVVCWGRSCDARLGDTAPGGCATATDPFARGPARVEGLPADITDLSTGRSHSCVVAAGDVHCWGYNGDGELGRDTASALGAAGKVAGLPAGKAHAVACGHDHSCAVVGDAREVFCWGLDNSGSTGVDYNYSPGYERRGPVTTRLGPPLAGVTQLAAGKDYTCALTGAGELYCWGARGAVDGGAAGRFGKALKVEVK